MPFNIVVDSIHRKNFVADVLQVKCNFTRKTAVLHFYPPPLVSIGSAYDVHLKPIGKRLVDFLLVLSKLFSLVVTAEALRAISIENRRFRSNRISLTQNFR